MKTKNILHTMLLLVLLNGIAFAAADDIKIASSWNRFYGLIYKGSSSGIVHNSSFQVWRDGKIIGTFVVNDVSETSSKGVFQPAAEGQVLLKNDTLKLAPAPVPSPVQAPKDSASSTASVTAKTSDKSSSKGSSGPLTASNSDAPEPTLKPKSKTKVKASHAPSGESKQQKTEPTKLPAQKAEAKTDQKSTKKKEPAQPEVNPMASSNSDAPEPQKPASAAKSNTSDKPAQKTETKSAAATPPTQTAKVSVKTESADKPPAPLPSPPSAQTPPPQQFKIFSVAPDGQTGSFLKSASDTFKQGDVYLVIRNSIEIGSFKVDTVAAENANGAFSPNVSGIKLNQGDVLEHCAACPGKSEKAQTKTANAPSPVTDSGKPAKSGPAITTEHGKERAVIENKPATAAPAAKSTVEKKPVASTPSPEKKPSPPAPKAEPVVEKKPAEKRQPATKTSAEITSVPQQKTESPEPKKDSMKDNWNGTPSAEPAPVSPVLSRDGNHDVAINLPGADTRKAPAASTSQSSPNEQPLIPMKTISKRLEFKRPAPEKLSVEDNLKIGDSFFEDRVYALAIEYYNAAYAKTPENVRARDGVIKTSRMLGIEVPAALASASKNTPATVKPTSENYKTSFEDNNFDISRAQNNAAVLLLQQDNFKEAIENFDKAIETNPNVSIFYRNRAVALFRYGKTEAALKDAQKALDMGDTKARELIETMQTVSKQKKSPAGATK